MLRRTAPAWFDEAMRHVGYVILFVADLERSVDFYRDVVGLEFRLAGVG